MKNATLGLTVLLLALAMLAGPVAAQSDSITRSYGDVNLSGGFQTGHLSDVWNLTACPLTIHFTYDANGLVDDLVGDDGQVAFGQSAVGLRQLNMGQPLPANDNDGARIWLLANHQKVAGTFDPDPPGAPSLDIDDHLLLQQPGGGDEGRYDLPATPPNPGANHAFWFDRDGVDPWQAQLWGAIDGATYNTAGLYDVVVTLQATGPLAGRAYMTVNGQDQGFYVPQWHDGPPDLMPAGMTFSGAMARMQVFYGIAGEGATHSVAFRNLVVEGCSSVLFVAIDIQPGTYPNVVNLGSQGTVPVAVFSTPHFDATLVDPGTVTLAGAGVALRGGSGKYLADVKDLNGDGLDDLLLKIKIEEIDPAAIARGYAALTGESAAGYHVDGKDQITATGP